MRQLVIKPGSIMLWKSYGKLKDGGINFLVRTYHIIMES